MSRPQGNETRETAETTAQLDLLGSYENYGQVRDRSRPAGGCVESA